MTWLGACATTFVTGFVYFLAAVPTGAALKLPLWLAALCAWLGYSSGAVLVAFAGAPLREWLMQRLKIRPDPDKPSLVLRAWNRYGLIALGLLGPVTIGPQAGALLGLALGAPRGRLVLAISAGAIPWTVAFAALVGLGIKIVK